MAAPSPRRRLLLLGAAAVAAVAVVALVLTQLTEPSQKTTTVAPAAASGTDTESEPTLSPGPEDGGTYQDAREIMTQIEHAYGKTCDSVSYSPLNINGTELGEDTYALCQLGLGYAKIHVFPVPVNSFAWQTVFSASMRGNYVILYGQNWIINATGADQFGLAAHRVLGGHTKVAP